jgi:hypothetical protein
MSNTNPNAIGDAYPNADCYSNVYPRTNTDSNPNPYSYSYSDGNPIAYSNANTYAMSGGHSIDCVWYVCIVKHRDRRRGWRLWRAEWIHRRMDDARGLCR